MTRSMLVAMMAGLAVAMPAVAQEEPEFPAFDDVAKDFEEVSAGQDGPGWWKVWRRDRDAQLLAELPSDFEGQRFFLTGTVAAGSDEVGVYPQYTMYGGNAERYVYWSRFDKSLALIEPNVFVRSSGDEQSQAAASRVNTDRVVSQVGILCMGPGGGPVIDLDQFLLGESGEMFGFLASGMNPSLARIEKVKTFPLNTEVALTLPVLGGRLATLHYSASRVEGDPSYQPREADRRVGFFYTYHIDPAKNDGESQTKRYATRWHLQKAAPELKLSPPVRPVVFYIEHTTPLRYRRWVRDGILEWNKAFERVGISGAIEVQIQDAASGSHMDKDPEDIRYNFIRWTNSNMGYAIGPSRAHPETGQILDADIVMDEGFVSGYAAEWTTVIAEEAMRGFGAQSLAWFKKNPSWDPRILLGVGKPVEAQAARQSPEIPARLRGRVHPMGCACAAGRTGDVALARAIFAMDEVEGEPGEDALDGLPESFIGPLIKDVIMHEVGHTLGLMHNFKASSIYTYDQINSDEWKGKKTISGSVMDYHPTNIAPKGAKQGDYGMIGIGPYDFWAIEWGYTLGDPAEVVKRVAEPELAFRSDEGNGGSDPLTQVWDLGSDSLKRAEKEVELATQVRSRIMEKVVKDGQSWSKARRAYMMTLRRQLGAAASAASWIGGAYVHRDFKGDPNARDPVVPVSAADQRKALKFVLETSFRDAAYGLTPELLAKMTDDQWWDEMSWFGGNEPDWTPNDMVLSVQSSILSRLMSPDMLQRIYDNEVRVPAGDDVVTIPEVLEAVRAEIWTEVAKPASGSFTARKPMVSSYRRNLQREHLERLVTLATYGAWGGASGGPLEDVARQQLRDLKGVLDGAPIDRADPYTKAHLNECKEQVNRALEAIYIRGR